MPTLSDDWHPRDERDARIEELEEENERLRAKINKALKAAPKNPDRVYHRNFPVYIQAMVKALGGEK